jgi:hypothetical protein
MYMAEGLLLDYLTEGGSKLLRIVGINIPIHVTSYRKRREYSVL